MEEIGLVTPTPGVTALPVDQTPFSIENHM